MKKEYISEIAWSKIFSFLKEQKNLYTKAEKSCKRFIEATFWIAKTGAQWRELPEEYGNWNTVFSRFNVWSKKHLWEELLNFCAKDPDLEYVMIDATIVRAHACSAGYNAFKNEELGRSKGGFTTKIHASVDALGNPLKFVVTPGQRNDITQADILLKDVSESYVIADKGYDSTELRSKLIEKNCVPVIPSRSNRKEQYPYDEHLYKERHAIECLFSKMKHFRRVFSRFDKSARNFLSFLSFVGACIWLR
jgi:transposase